MMSWSFFPISLKGDRSHLPLVQNLEFILSDQLAFHHGQNHFLKSYSCLFIFICQEMKY